MRFFIRLISTLIILILIFIASHSIIRLLPGDPLSLILAETGTSIPASTLREELQLDLPFLHSVGISLSRVFKGDLGRSILTGEPVAPLVLRRFFNTLELVLWVILIGSGISLLIGLLAAASPHRGVGRLADRICTFHGALGAALPTPWIGPILAYLFAVLLPVFPMGGHVALPALTLALTFSGFWARLIRLRVRETLKFGSAIGARARGLGETRIVLKYGFIPCSGSLIGYLGTQIGLLLGGSFVAEVIFDWPGIGSLIVHSVLARDYPVIEAGLFLSASASLLGTLAGDWAQSALSLSSLKGGRAFE